MHKCIIPQERKRKEEENKGTEKAGFRLSSMQEKKEGLFRCRCALH
jgi:hypothetical protein